MWRLKLVIATDREGLVVSYGAIRMIRYVSVMLLDMLDLLGTHINHYIIVTISLSTTHIINNNNVKNKQQKLRNNEK